jgi:hypothetical protein
LCDDLRSFHSNVTRRVYGRQGAWLPNDMPLSRERPNHSSVWTELSSSNISTRRSSAAAAG